jgi:nitronate monooxygenase
MPIAGIAISVGIDDWRSGHRMSWSSPPAVLPTAAGTRFYATKESLEPDAAKTKVLSATGDETIRTTVYDIVNNRAWPPGYTGRVVRNKFVEKWHGHEKELARAQEDELRKVGKAITSGDFETANVTVGESVGLVHDIPRAAEVIDRLVAEASALFKKFAPIPTAA